MPRPRERCGPAPGQARPLASTGLRSGILPDEIVRQTEQVVGWSAGVQQHDDEAEDQRGGIAEPQLFKPKADRA